MEQHLPCRRVLGVFAKQPLPGQVKTRLAVATSPEWAAALAAAFLEDLVERLAAVEAERVFAFAPPRAKGYFTALVRGRFAVRLADSDEVQEFVPGDVFDIPPRHDAWVVGDEPAELIDLSGNSAQFGLPAAVARQVVTMLMSDIVDSTPTAARLGDARWRQTLADHNRIVRREIERFRGREIDTTGDGFFVAFDSAAAAVHCARAIRDAVQRLDL